MEEEKRLEQKKPLVSVVIPCYNHAQFVQESIQSVIDQDYDNIELIIIDDGSKDNSVEVIQQMIPACEERFVRFEFRYRPNNGLCATLNEALEWCRGEYFSPLASDDVLISQKVKDQIEKLSLLGKEYVGVFGSAQKIDSHGNVLGVLNLKNSSIYHFLDIYFHKHNLPACTQMLRTNEVRKVGGYSEEYRIEDWYMWLKLTQNNKYLVSMPCVFSQYRTHSSNTSSNTNLMHEERIKIMNSEVWGVSNKEKSLAFSMCCLSTSIESTGFISKFKFILKSIFNDIRVLRERKLYISLYKLFL